jgi:hypothetical protein
LAFRGIDLLDVYRGRMSIRRLRVLIQGLPPESATRTALRNAQPEDTAGRPSGEYRPDKAPWSAVEMLLAAIKDEVTLSRNAAIAIAGGKPGEFHPTPRPGIPPKSAARKGLTDEQRRALDPRLRNQTQKEA